jgi:hypothetical protein
MVFFIHDDDIAVNLAFRDGAAALLCLVALEMAGDELTMTYMSTMRMYVCMCVCVYVSMDVAARRG